MRIIVTMSVKKKQRNATGPNAFYHGFKQIESINPDRKGWFSLGQRSVAPGNGRNITPTLKGSNKDEPADRPYC